MCVCVCVYELSLTLHSILESHSVIRLPFVELPYFCGFLAWDWILLAVVVEDNLRWLSVRCIKRLYFIERCCCRQFTLEEGFVLWQHAWFLFIVKMTQGVEYFVMCGQVCICVWIWTCMQAGWPKSHNAGYLLQLSYWWWLIVHLLNLWWLFFLTWHVVSKICYIDTLHSKRASDCDV